MFYWIASINSSGLIDLASSQDRQRIVRTKALIQKIKNWLSRKKSSTQLLAQEMKTSYGTNYHRINKIWITYLIHKQISPKTIDQHKIDRKYFEFESEKILKNWRRQKHFFLVIVIFTSIDFQQREWSNLHCYMERSRWWKWWLL